MKHLQTLCLVLSIVMLSVSAQAADHAPSDETMALSLRTMSKALAACRVSYTDPVVKAAVGAVGYDKDMQTLTMAEKLTNFYIANSNRITGKGLVMILSTSDDFQVGVGSSRFQLLNAGIQGTIKPDIMMAVVTGLTDCQQSLFNAGDDYVTVTLDTVGAEDDTLIAVAKKLSAK
jgi:hypothetical protein